MTGYEEGALHLLPFHQMDCKKFGTTNIRMHMALHTQEPCCKLLRNSACGLRPHGNRTPCGRRGLGARGFQRSIARVATRATCTLQALTPSVGPPMQLQLGTRRGPPCGRAADAMAAPTDRFVSNIAVMLRGKDRVLTSASKQASGGLSCPVSRQKHTRTTNLCRSDAAVLLIIRKENRGQPFVGGPY